MPLSAAGLFKYVLTFLLPADIKGFKMVWHFLKLHQVNLVKPSVQNESEFFRTSESLFSIRNSAHWFRESIQKSAQILLRNSWKKGNFTIFNWRCGCWWWFWWCYKKMFAVSKNSVTIFRPWKRWKEKE